MSTYNGDLFFGQSLWWHCWAKQMASNEGIADEAGALWWEYATGWVRHPLNGAGLSMPRLRRMSFRGDARNGLGMLR